MKKIKQITREQAEKVIENRKPFLYCITLNAIKKESEVEEG